MDKKFNKMKRTCHSVVRTPNHPPRSLSSLLRAARCTDSNSSGTRASGGCTFVLNEDMGMILICAASSTIFFIKSFHNRDRRNQVTSLSCAKAAQTTSTHVLPAVCTRHPRSHGQKDRRCQGSASGISQRGGGKGQIGTGRGKI